MRKEQQITIEPKSFTYLFNPPGNQLAADQSLIAATVDIELDSDFQLAGIFLPFATGPFEFQILDGFDYALMSDFMNSEALSTSATFPSALCVGHVFPAGSTIKINITDLSGEPNPLQLAFVGEKLFGVRHD